MKFYSEETGQLYATEEDLKKAEEIMKEKLESKKAAEKEIKEAYRDALKACDHYYEVAKKHKQNAFTSDEFFDTFLNLLFG